MAESEPSPISPASLGRALAEAGQALTGSDDGDNAPPSSAATADVTALAADMAEIRKHLTRIGAALGAAAVAILGGLGYAQVHQAFPLPAGSYAAVSAPQWLIWFLVCLVCLGIAAVVWHRFFLACMRTMLNVAGFLLLVAAILFLPWAAGSLRGDVSVEISRPRALTAALALASFLAVGGAAWLASRFFGAQRRILIASDDTLTKFVDAEERKAREYLFQDVARGENAASLRDLEYRIARLKRISTRLPKESEAAKRADSEAKSLEELVSLALYSAALWILEYRSSKAFDGWKSKLALGMTVVGLVLIFGIADYAKGERELIDLRAKCQNAVTAGAIDACDPVRSSLDTAAAELRLAQAQNKLAEALVTARQTLEGAAPVTRAQKVEWLTACVTVLRAVPALKTEPGLLTKCSALLS